MGGENTLDFYFVISISIFSDPNLKIQKFRESAPSWPERRPRRSWPRCTQSQTFPFQDFGREEENQEKGLPGMIQWISFQPLWSIFRLTLVKLLLHQTYKNKSGSNVIKLWMKYYKTLNVFYMKVPWWYNQSLLSRWVQSYKLWVHYKSNLSSKIFKLAVATKCIRDWGSTLVILVLRLFWVTFELEVSYIFHIQLCQQKSGWALKPYYRVNFSLSNWLPLKSGQRF